MFEIHHFFALSDVIRETEKIQFVSMYTDSQRLSWSFVIHVDWWCSAYGINRSPIWFPAYNLWCHAHF